MFNIVQRRKWFFLFSGLVILAGLIAMAISIATYPEHAPVRLSIDFIGGSLIEVEFKPIAGAQQPGQITEADLIKAFKDFVPDEPRIQRLSEVGGAASNRWQIRTTYIDNDTASKL